MTKRSVARASSSTEDVTAPAALNDNDPDAVVLRSEILDFAGRAETMSRAEMLDGIVRIGWSHDLNREVIGARAIAQAVYGRCNQQAVERVKKFEERGICTFRRWDGGKTISLLLGEIMVVRMELQARGRLD
ncbi:hypothetical protein BZG35_03475 [Brevundimonas sp. LM2]|uniref:hypothetical protein n=1 Tax=Brevundimonas sp. LM2 TaxID=1938605 RepID=UPI00098395D7|nr:hypothetical protein [Brevundimonas sp. LM2]AQR60816.1 hypothetical protein BZG35_03475 [Brevundimonas sp. LM2]